MINYDLNKIRAVVFDVDGVLSRETITLSPEGEPLRTVNIKDGYALQLAAKMGLTVGIITGGKTEAVRRRYTSLGLTEVHMGQAIKIAAYEEMTARLGLTDEEVIYVGDDIPDLEVMARVGCPCCPLDAATEVREAALYISHRKGGEGVGRDIVEQVLRAQGRWMADERAFGW